MHRRGLGLTTCGSFAALPEGKVADRDGGDYPTRGVAGFVARAEELAAKYGERFTPLESLKK